MIECLCSLTVGNPIIAQALESGGSLDSPFLNGVAIAIDLSAFGDVRATRIEAERLGSAISALPRANAERIFLPGERGDSVTQERERNGIPNSVGNLVSIADGGEQTRSWGSGLLPRTAVHEVICSVIWLMAISH